MPREQSEYQKSFNDVLMQIAGPALIMLLVGSLVFFMLHVLYQGDYPFRVNYVFGLFIFAAVLISRISIEEGFERAAIYGLVLAAVVFFVSNFFLTTSGALAPFAFLINGMFIVFIWWCASRLTWDCTVNDSSRDVSATGLVELFRRKITLSDQQNSEETEPIDTTTQRNNPQAYDDLVSDPEEDLSKATWDRKLLNMWPFKRKKNTPGLWIFYYSIMAIPIFGIGQAFIPSTSVEDRRYAFFLFVVFVVAVLGLLMMTSLMGLQRYLKKRNTAMPDSIAKTWMVFGAIFGIAILSIAWLLPRPAPEYSFTQLLPKWTTPDRRTSNWAIGNDGKKKSDQGNRTEKNENAKQTQSSKNSKKSGGNAESKKASGGKSSQKKSGKSGGSKGNKKSKSSGGQKSKSGKKSSGGDKSKSSKSDSKSNSKSDSKKSDSNSKNNNQKKSNSDPNNIKSDRPKSTKNPPKGSLEEYNQQRKNDPGHWKKKNSGNSSPSQRKKSQSNKNSSRPRSSTPPPPPPSNSPPPAPSLGVLAILLKWIMIIVILAIIIFVAIKYRKELWASLKAFIEELKQFFAKLFGEKESDESPVETTDDGRVIIPVKQFHEYSNPFDTGAAAKMTDEQLVGYTFEAFTAWGAIFNCQRLADQTPHEYVRQLARAQKHLKRGQMDEFANLVCQILFGPPDSNSQNAAYRPPLQAFWKAMQDNAHRPAISVAQLAPT